MVAVVAVHLGSIRLALPSQCSSQAAVVVVETIPMKKLFRTHQLPQLVKLVGPDSLLPVEPVVLEVTVEHHLVMVRVALAG
jgi:hypothetical protein